MCGTCGCDTESPIPATPSPLPLRRQLHPEISLLEINDRQAALNRQWFGSHQLLALNLVSSPGSGKTTLLEHTARAWVSRAEAFCVIEGDQHTRRDAERIRKAGARAVQINTGKLCHLEAMHVEKALAEFDGTHHGVIVIENVGNLICPTHFDLGEHLRVTLLSVTEGDDKPLKYPDSLIGADLLLITKTDLLPYVDFDVEAASHHARSINPDIEIIHVNSKSSAGFAPWMDWLEGQWSAYRDETQSDSPISRNAPPNERRY